MVFHAIEKLQREYTDKYVVVDDQRPELRRFSGMTGIVKTVNMSGRALVQFDANNNIGWYDIHPDFLKVVEAPAPKKAEAKAAKPAMPKTQDTLTAKPAVAKPAAAQKPARAAGMSVADILAAARGGASAKPKEATAARDQAKLAGKPEAKKLTTAEILAAARAKKGGEAGTAPTAKPPGEEKAGAAAGPAVQKLDPKKMSTADILAAARAKKAGGSAEAPAPTAPSPDAAEPPKKSEPKKMTTAEILAAARR